MALYVRRRLRCYYQDYSPGSNQLEILTLNPLFYRFILTAKIMSKEIGHDKEKKATEITRDSF